MKEAKEHSDDSPINLELTRGRLKKFHDPELKEKYSKIWTIGLRIVYNKLLKQKKRSSIN